MRNLKERSPIRFYYSKSLNCCIEIRLLLGCPASYLLPCREFVGNCGDTKDQFATLQDSGIPDDYECHQFPDETAFKDKIIVGLICTAVAIPFTFVIGEIFAKGNEPEFPELQARASRARVQPPLCYAPAFMTLCPHPAACS